MLIKDVCRITGLNSSAIRYYDSQGLLYDVKRGANNYRVFDNNDVDLLIFIRKARDLGFSLDEVKEVIAIKRSGKETCSYVINRLNEKIRIIDDQIKELEAEKEILNEHLKEGSTVCCCKGTVCHYIEGLEE